MRTVMFILLIIILIMSVISRLILRYKFKIQKPQYIDINTLQSKYYKHIVVILLIFSVLISFYTRQFDYMALCFLIKLLIDSVYRIKYLRNDKSRYYNIIELVFWVYGCITFVASFFW